MKLFQYARTVVRVAASALFLAPVVMRTMFQYYGMPGFSMKGLEYPSEGAALVVTASMGCFLLGTWVLRGKWHALVFQVGSVLLMTAYDFQLMWSWGGHPLVPEISDLVWTLENAVFPVFWVTKGFELAALGLCLVQLAISAWLDRTCVGQSE